MSARVPTRSPSQRRAERMRGVGDDRQRDRAGPESAIRRSAVVVGRMAGVVDRQDRPGPGRDRLGDGLRSIRRVPRVDIGEARFSADVEDGVGRRDERHRRGDRLVAATQAGRVRGAVEGGRTRAERHRVPRPGRRSERLLELPDSAGRWSASRRAASPQPRRRPHRRSTGGRTAAGRPGSGGPPSIARPAARPIGPVIRPAPRPAAARPSRPGPGPGHRPAKPRGASRGSPLPGADRSAGPRSRSAGWMWATCSIRPGSGSISRGQLVDRDVDPRPAVEDPAGGGRIEQGTRRRAGHSR